MPYRLSSRAEQDLDDVWLSVAEDASPTTADRLIDDLVDRFDLLAEQPRMGRLRPEFGPGVRSISVENHVIYYRHDGAAPDRVCHEALWDRRDDLYHEMLTVPPVRLERNAGETLTRAVLPRW